jgi:hypothetical protein
MLSRTQDDCVSLWRTWSRCTLITDSKTDVFRSIVGLLPTTAICVPITARIWAEEDFIARQFAEQYRAPTHDCCPSSVLRETAVDGRWNGQKPLCLRGLTAGSLALETLQERRKQRSQTSLVVRVGIHFSGRREFVDNLWQVFS